MDDLHAPTVASGPTSNGYGSSDGSNRPLMDLISEKDKVEAELQALGSVLESVSGLHGANASHERWNAC